MFFAVQNRKETDELNGFREFWEGLNWSVLTEMLTRVIPSLLCITLHELSHGYVAYRLGDDTAKRAGRLTLNPLRHIDPMGLVMMVVFRFGWAKPVPVNMNRFQNPKRGMAITAVAGPACNLLLGVVLLFLYGLLFAPLRNTDNSFSMFLIEMLFTAAYLSFALAVFNILPVPPLDGSKVLFSLLNEEQYRWIMRYERYGMILLLIVVWTGLLGKPLSSATVFLFDFFYPIAELGYRLMELVL